MCTSYRYPIVIYCRIIFVYSPAHFLIKHILVVVVIGLLYKTFADRYLNINNNINKKKS